MGWRNEGGPGTPTHLHVRVHLFPLYSIMADLMKTRVGSTPAGTKAEVTVDMVSSPALLPLCMIMFSSGAISGFLRSNTEA